MDENEIISNANAEDIPASEADLAEFDREWDGDSPDGLFTEADGNDTTDAPPAEDSFTLKHLGEVTTVDRDRVIALAQMGLDYDRIRAERDALRPLREQTRDMERALADIADEKNTSVAQLVEGSRLSDESRRGLSLQEFARERSDVRAEDIPAGVWQEFFRSGDLSAAYAKYENTLLRASLDQQRQADKNAARSTGSMASGGECGGKDAFDEGWGE